MPLVYIIAYTALCCGAVLYWVRLHRLKLEKASVWEIEFSQANQAMDEGSEE